MNYILKCILSIFLISLSSCATNVYDEPGNLTCSMEGGALRCRSQMDASGKTVALLESLKPNTTIKVENVGATEGGYLVSLHMYVEKKSVGFDRWTHIQPISFIIHPVRVDQITLTGESVYLVDFFEILIAEGCQELNP